jgi:hypothetical protein
MSKAERVGWALFACAVVLIAAWIWTSGARP